MELNEEEYYALDRVLRNINREVRLKGIKQEVLADMMGIRQNHLSEKLNGKNGLKVSFVIKICKALEIPLASVFDIPERKSTNHNQSHDLNQQNRVIGNSNQSGEVVSTRW